MVFHLMDEAGVINRVDAFPDGNLTWILPNRVNGWLSLDGIRFTVENRLVARLRDLPARLPDSMALELDPYQEPYGAGYTQPQLLKVQELCILMGRVTGPIRRFEKMAQVPMDCWPESRLVFNTLVSGTRTTRLDVSRCIFSKKCAMISIWYCGCAGRFSKTVRSCGPVALKAVPGQISVPSCIHLGTQILPVCHSTLAGEHLEQTLQSPKCSAMANCACLQAWCDLIIPTHSSGTSPLLKFPSPVVLTETSCLVSTTTM